MPEPTPPNHWDFLASDLGAEPVAEPQRPQPASPPPLPEKKASRPAHRPASPPKPASWDALASQLGIAPSPPSASTEPPAAPPSPAEKPELNISGDALAPSPVPPPLHDAALLASLPPGAPEDSPNFFDERFDFEEPFDLLEAGEANLAVPASESALPASTEKSSRRRRRRRKPRRPSDSGEAGVSAETRQKPDRAVSLPDAEVEGQPLTQDRRDTGEESSDEEHRPSKRRRPRRGKKRREQKSGEIPSDAPHRVQSDEAGMEIDFDAAQSEEDANEPAARLGFRGIPTWEEVVGLLIDKNLEARSKRPSNGSHQGRGNRGRGGKRRSY